MINESAKISLEGRFLECILELIWIFLGAAYGFGQRRYCLKRIRFYSTATNPKEAYNLSYVRLSNKYLCLGVVVLLN